METSMMTTDASREQGVRTVTNTMTMEDFDAQYSKRRTPRENQT
jgi:hypothetical protein